MTRRALDVAGNGRHARQLVEPASMPEDRLAQVLDIGTLDEAGFAEINSSGLWRSYHHGATCREAIGLRLTTKGSG